MAGYIVELYKNIISDENYWAEQSIGDPDLKNKVYITYGEFDKMTVTRTNAFSRMRDVSKMSREWIGDRQKLLLYEIDQDNQLVYSEDSDNCGFYTIDTSESLSLCKKLFLGITILQFKESQDESTVSIQECLSICRKNILKVVETNRTHEVPIDCSVLGLLGSYGVVVVWACDQFTEILRMINLIKGTDVLSTEEMKDPAYRFISVFTIFAKNKDGYNPEAIEKLQGTAMLQITLQSNLNSDILQELKENISNTANLHSVGEYDLVLTTEAKNIYNLFENDAIFDPSSDFYKHHVLQTNVRLCENISEDSLKAVHKGKIMEKPGSRPESRARIEEKYKALRELFFATFPKTAGMVDSLDLLYGDYNSKIASVSNKMWAKDYSQQFLAILTIIEKNLQAATDECSEISMAALLADIQAILNCFEYQTIHIAESDNLLLDTPKCHLRYTGQNNLTLYAYFGIIKDIIELVYLIQNESKQSKIIPLISVDTVPIIKSVLFMDYSTPFEDRVIEFKFPMMAMYSLPAYVPYLYHEVFHYAAPRDRVVRNLAKAYILAIQAMRNVVCELLASSTDLQDECMAADLTDAVFIRYIYEAVIEYYDDDLAAKAEKASEFKTKRQEINDDGQTWNQYVLEFLEYLLECAENAVGILPEDNLIYEVLRKLYDRKNEITDSIQVWLEEKYVPEPEAGAIKAAAASLFESLIGISGNINLNKCVETLQDILGSVNANEEDIINSDELMQLSDALSEVASDLPMVELADMDAVAYLLSYVKVQNDLLKKADDEIQLQHYIRIGAVIDSIFSWKGINYSRQKFKFLKSEFVESYLGLYFSEKSALTYSNPKNYVDEIKNDAECRFKKIQEWYYVYLQKYRIYSKLIQTISSQASIKDRLSEENADFINRFRHLKSEEYNDAVKTYGRWIMDSVNPDNHYTLEESKEQIREAKEVFQKKIFSMNVEIIQTYQKQRTFEQLGDICGTSFKGDVPYSFAFEKKALEQIKLQPVREIASQNTVNRTEIYKCKINNIVGLCEVIKGISEHFAKLNLKKYGDNRCGLWYRGHQDSSYKLLPSAMRKYVRQSGDYRSLRDYQRDAYEQFKFRMDDASEKIEKTGYTDCDYLALMQHYGAPTIYMDWTENAFSAMYFALEAYIDPAKKKEQNKKNAALYILNPNLYNEARNQMMALVSDSGRELDRLMQDTKINNTCSLPNLSVAYNRDRFEMFLLGDVNKSCIVESKNERINELSVKGKEERLLYLPLSIYASRTNNRIRAQSGMFMAYNIFTEPSEKKYFDYMALEKVQEFYLQQFKDESPFLYLIEIEGTRKEEIANWLKAIGVTKDIIYPELSNIGERIF